MPRNLPRCRCGQTHLHRRAFPERRAAFGILPQLSARAGRALGPTSERGRGGTVREGRSQSPAPFGCRPTQGDVGEGAGENGRVEGAGGEGEKKGGREAAG